MLLIRSLALLLSIQQASPKALAPEDRALFRWFDSVTPYVSLAGDFIDYWPTLTKPWRPREVQGFIVARTKDQLKIRTLNLKIGWLPIEPAADRPPNNLDPGVLLTKRDAFYHATYGQMSQSIGDDNSLELFVLARWAAKSGDFALANRSLSLSRAFAQLEGMRSTPYSKFIEKRAEGKLFDALLYEVSDPSLSREQLATRFASFARSFPRGDHKSLALQLAEGYRASTRLSSSFLESAADAKKENVAALISDLQELSAGNPMAYEFGFPKNDVWIPDGRVLNTTAEYPGPSGKLVRMGSAAVPLLIDGLNLGNLTRITTQDASYPVLTVGDVCERILEAIAGTVFLDHDVALAPCQTPKFYYLARRRIEDWWSAQKHD